jgi:hypothetical protein
MSVSTTVGQGDGEPGSSWYSVDMGQSHESRSERGWCGVDNSEFSMSDKASLDAGWLGVN